MPSFLPREGLTLEVALTPLRLTVFEPLFTGAVLLALSYFPKQISLALHIEPQPCIESESVLFALKVLVGVGIVLRLNNLLSRLSLNSYTSSTWNHGKEIVVITGGTGGLGVALTFELAPSSAAVILLDIKPPEPLDGKVYPKKTFYYEVDLTSPDDLAEIARHIRHAHGLPTVLINNATKSVNRPILNQSDEDLQDVFGVNILAHFRTVKEFLPAMVKRNHGHVVTIASVSSYSVRAQDVDYACTKAAQLAFHEGLGQELRWRYNAPKVRTTIVHPGYIRTAPAAHLISRPGFNELVMEPETVAEAVVKQLHSGNGGQLFIPSRFTFVSGLRGWPSWMQEFARNGLANQFSSEDFEIPVREDSQLLEL